MADVEKGSVANSDTDSRREFYQSTRAELVSARTNAFSQADKTVLTLSSAGLALSVTVVEKIANPAQLECVLIASWVFFGIAIGSTLASFRTSIGALNRQLQFAKEYYLEHDEEALTRESRYSLVTRVLNGVATLAFLLAVATTLVFASCNVLERERERTMAREGFVPPAMAPAGAGGKEEVKKGETPAPMAPIPPEPSLPAERPPLAPSKPPPDKGPEKGHGK